ncbi:MAG: hypothetical protein RLZZ04_4632 [Cyanobacteriota bacterium]|jgi:uncharacterized phage-associated protein
MANVFDVANYILEKKAPITVMKLQKLVYYSQAWSLVWDEKPLFEEEIQAWRHGPVVPELYKAHAGQFRLESLPSGDGKNLTSEEKETVDSVLETYGERSSQWLSDLTHMESPWIDARKGLPADSSSQNEITHASMAEYYSSL